MAKTAQQLEEAELLERMARLTEAFRPSAPVDRRGLFAGRTAQIGELFSVVGQPGQHAVVYGERGVGKTSLAAVVGELLRGSGVGTMRVICDSSDDFATIWRKALGEIALRHTSSGIGFAPVETQEAEPASALLGAGRVTPHEVTRALAVLAQERPLAIFVDEFDRVVEPTDRALFAETIKMLSDRVVPATIVLVGVADDINELLREHRSVERALVQIRMPRMSRTELAQIATTGMERAQMTIQKGAVESATGLSQGLPHYTHLLSQLAGQAALTARRAEVRTDDMDAAVERAIERAGQSISEAYRRGTSGHDPAMLLACALADEDEWGYFAPPEGAQGLDDLVAPDTEVLQKRDDRYRFANPLLQPYVVMRGLAEGRIKASDVR